MADHHQVEAERNARRECIRLGFECAPAREAAKLFGVSPSTIKAAKAAKHVEPVFELIQGGGPAVPHYELSDLIAHFDRTGNAKADPEVLAKMRERGIVCYLQSHGGCWLLLSESGGVR